MKKSNKNYKCGPMGNGPSCIYGLGFIGAIVYYTSTATGFWSGVLGVLEALIWPAMLVYKLLAM